MSSECHEVKLKFSPESYQHLEDLRRRYGANDYGDLMRKGLIALEWLDARQRRTRMQRLKDWFLSLLRSWRPKHFDKSPILLNGLEARS
jgi:hypothetical protein